MRRNHYGFCIRARWTHTENNGCLNHWRPCSGWNRSSLNSALSWRRKKLPYLQDLKTEAIEIGRSDHSAPRSPLLHASLARFGRSLVPRRRAPARFQRRRDCKRYAEQLADTGIAGAPISFSFYAATAAWLADRWPSQLQIDWEAFDNVDSFEPYLDLLATYSETAALDNVPMELSDWDQSPQSTGRNGCQLRRQTPAETRHG